MTFKWLMNFFTDAVWSTSEGALNANCMNFLQMAQHRAVLLHNECLKFSNRKRDLRLERPLASVMP